MEHTVTIKLSLPDNNGTHNGKGEQRGREYHVGVSHNAPSRAFRPYQARPLPRPARILYIYNSDNATPDNQGYNA